MSDRIGTCTDGSCWWCGRTVGCGSGQCQDPESEECERWLSALPEEVANVPTVWGCEEAIRTTITPGGES